MRERLQQRLDELLAEQEGGEATLAQVERRTAELRATLQRIAGAISVLRELLDDRPPPRPADAG